MQRRSRSNGNGNGNKRQKTVSMGGPTCIQCGVEENTMKEWGPEILLEKCPDCKAVHYCSEECQLEHWEVHKETCASRKKERLRKKVRKVSLSGAMEDESVTESLAGVLEFEWLLSLVEDAFPSAGDTGVSDKTILRNAKRAVDIMDQEGDIDLTLLLFERILQDDRAPLNVLCMSRNEEDRVCLLCQDIMSVLLEGGLNLIETSDGIQHEEKWFLVSCQATLGLLGAFPGDAITDSIEPILTSFDPHKLYSNNIYSKKRATLYLSANFFQHMQLCQVLGKRMAESPNVPISWKRACTLLLHLLVPCLSYPEPAEAVLFEANEALIHHEETSKAGLKEFFQPLMALFQVVRNSKDPKSEESKILMHILCQVASLLVAQSRRVQQSPRPLFDTQPQYLEFLFHTQFNGEQTNRWNMDYLPWAHKIVTDRSG